MLAKAGNYADSNGDADNVFLTACRIIELVTEVYQLATGARSRPGPGYILAGFAMFASGIGAFGISKGSSGEIATGCLQSSAAFSIFYGDKVFPRLPVGGAKIGGMLYNLSCVPLLVAGIGHGNPFEWGAALAFICSNLSIACKPRPVPPAGV